MKNLITLSKSAISTCFLLFLSIVSYGQTLHNFTKVQQDEGLIMRRAHKPGELPGVAVMNFHSDDTIALTHPDYIYMRATAKTDTLNPNNLIITDKGLLIVASQDDCARFTLPEVDDNSEINNIKLYVNGKIAVSDGNATNIIVSDERFKKNIEPLKNSLEVIRQSNFVQYEYNNLSGVPSKKKYYGILAQEMQKVLPSTVSKSTRKVRPTDKERTEFFMFNPNDLIYSGLNAIKELDEENQILKDRVTELEEKVEESKALEQRVVELENILSQLIDKKDTRQEDALYNEISEPTSSYLYQNQPNPVYNTTEIRYRLPSNTSNAQIVIQDINGNKITEFELNRTGTGKATFNPKQYGISSGVYIYTLVVNSMVIESKKMTFIE